MQILMMFIDNFVYRFLFLYSWGLKFINKKLQSIITIHTQNGNSFGNFHELNKY